MHSAFAAFQPVNEPWWNTPLDPLFDYYRKVRKLVQRFAPQAKFVFHDSFRFDPDTWNKLFRADDVHNVVIDHHYYWAFQTNLKVIDDFCGQVKTEAAIADKLNMEVWFGEWSLATDNCAQHLNGLNDGTMNPNFKCA